MLQKNICYLIITLFLASCSVFGPIKTEPSKTYVINALPAATTKLPHSSATLLVLNVDADPIYNTTDMAYTICPYQLAYFAKNGWAETPAQMLQPLIVQALQNTHYFHAVIASSSIGHYDYILSTKLLELKQVFSPFSSEIHLRLRAQIVKASTNQVIATKEFFIAETAPERSPYGGVIAANRATAVMLGRVVRFCLTAL